MTKSPCPPLGDDQWPVSIADLNDDFAGALNVYRTMAHHPDLLRAWAPLRMHIVKDTALAASVFSPYASNLVVLQVVRIRISISISTSVSSE